MLARPDRPVIKFPPRHLPEPFPLPVSSDARDQAAFDILDSDGDGKLSKDEFKRAGVPEDRQKLFDADGDGSVSESEYTETRRYEREFNDKDQNGDGSLSRDEMNPWHLNPLPQPFPIGRPWLTKLAAKAGLIEDKGGAAPTEGKAIGEPDPNASTIWHNPGFFPQLKDRFARFDKDGDGKVSKQEYVDGRRAENKPLPIFQPPILYKDVTADVGSKKEIVSGTDTLKLSGNTAPQAQDDQQ